jgi:glycosyltransferase involved in cell wall biosynthesis
MAVYGAGAALLTRRPHVITMHGDSEQTRFWRRRVALRWAFRRSQAVIAVSENMRTELITALGWAGEIGVVVNGVPGDKGDRSRIRGELGVTPDEFLIVAVGSYCRRKAHLDLLLALEQIGNAVPWRVAVAGPPGDASHELHDFVETRGWQSRAHLLGPREDVRDLLAASDLYVMPSLWEGLPLALLEAMFSEKPIISTTAGGIPETVQHDEEAVLVPPSDPTSLAEAIRTMFENPTRAAQLAASGRRSAEARFSLDRMVQAYEETYYSVMRMPQ